MTSRPYEVILGHVLEKVVVVSVSRLFLWHVFPALTKWILFAFKLARYFKQIVGACEFDKLIILIVNSEIQFVGTINVNICEVYYRLMLRKILYLLR